MSVELALWTFPAPRLPTTLGITSARELHARGFDFTAVRFRVVCPLETWS